MSTMEKAELLGNVESISERGLKSMRLLTEQNEIYEECNESNNVRLQNECDRESRTV